MLDTDMILDLFETLPISVFYLAVALLMTGFGEIGYQYGTHARTRVDREAPASLVPMVGGLLGMLAFVLAFTFSLATTQHDIRKSNVLDEANAIGTAYLRADMLDEQYGAKAKVLLREYVAIRLDATRGGDLEAVLARSSEIRADLWDQVSAAAIERPDPNTMLMVQAVNTVIDMNEKRITGALHNRIPGSVWFALTVIIALTMITLGAQVGLTGKRRLIAVIPLMLSFSVLVTLVVDLDRPQSGLVTVNQQSMINLQRDMEQ